MKKFFKEFKTFITRGNVLDMAVGVIVGGAFTAIVNSLSNNILKPIINWLLALIMGKDALSEVYTFLTKTTLEDGTIDLANSIYIDWGAFINAIINFLLIALVLFMIVKSINKFNASNNQLKNLFEKAKFDKAEKAELKQAGINPKDKKAAIAYFEKKEADAKAEAEAKAKAEAEEAKRHTTEGLLEDIKALLEKQINK